MKKISQEIFEKRIKERFPNQNLKIIQYTTTSSPFQIQCLNCGKVLSYPAAKNFLAKNKIAGCSQCYGLLAKKLQNLNKLKKRYDIIKEERDDKGKLQYTCQCKKCKRISTHLISSFLQNNCRCQGPGIHWTQQEFQQYLFNEYKNEYTLLSQFITVNSKSLFKHSCGFAWTTTPAHILYNKTGCPKCSKFQSKGCKVIEQQLKQLNLQYQKERFLDNSLQRFDFYLQIDNKKYAIEYNGRQHYEYIPFFHGHDIQVFKKYQLRDKKKADYCQKNNIQLVIIPYTLNNTEIIEYINKLFNSSTTSSQNVASSEAK